MAIPPAAVEDAFSGEGKLVSTWVVIVLARRFCDLFFRQRPFGKPVYVGTRGIVDRFDRESAPIVVKILPVRHVYVLSVRDLLGTGRRERFDKFLPRVARTHREPRWGLVGECGDVSIERV